MEKSWLMLYGSYNLAQSKIDHRYVYFVISTEIILFCVDLTATTTCLRISRYLSSKLSVFLDKYLSLSLAQNAVIKLFPDINEDQVTKTIVRESSVILMDTLGLF